MRTTEPNWTNTLTATSAALTNHKTSRQDRAVFCERVAILAEPLTLIDEQWQLAEPASCDANAKDAPRQALGLAVSELIGAMLIYAAKTVNPEIAAQVAFSPMEVIRGRATEIVARWRAFHATCAAISAETVCAA